jgi:glycine oxidase
LRDFLIIGGGVIGCATAWELAAAGARVTLVERGALGGESSWAGAGLLFPLLPWDYRPEVAQLAQAGRRRFAAWAAELAAESGVDPEYLESGLLVLPPYDREAALAWAAAEREEAAEVSPRLVEPQLDARGVALWLPRVAQVRNPRLLAALRGALAARGVPIVENAGVMRWQVKAGRIEAVLTADGQRLEAERYVVAAGAWSASLLAPLGLALPVWPVRGQMLLFHAPGALRHMVLAGGRYLIPRRDGHLLVGSTLEEVGFDKAVTEAARSELLTLAQTLVPALRGRVPLRQWAGLRPGSPDNLPVIDRAPGFSNLWLHTGHFRYGVTMAPASARLFADLVLGREPLLDPAPYRYRDQ